MIPQRTTGDSPPRPRPAGATRPRAPPEPPPCRGAGALQEVEVKATEILHFGACDSSTYPMAKKKHGMEFLREKAHLRPRTNTIGAVARMRNQLAYATHTFFQSHGFLYVHTPIITASDCEGAGEMFQVCFQPPRPRRPGAGGGTCALG